MFILTLLLIKTIFVFLQRQQETLGKLSCVGYGIIVRNGVIFLMTAMLYLLPDLQHYAGLISDKSYPVLFFFFNPYVVTVLNYLHNLFFLEKVFCYTITSS